MYASYIHTYIYNKWLAWLAEEAMTVKPHSACFYRYNGKEARAEALCIQSAKAREIQIINEIKSERQKKISHVKAVKIFHLILLSKLHAN